MKLFFDTETTGLDPKSDSILSIAMVATKDDLSYVNHLYLEMQPAKSIKFTANLMQALGVNGLDPKEIFNKPIAKDAFTEISKFLGSIALGFFKPVTPVGHNVKFDLEMLKSDAEFLGMESIMRSIHYHCEDTMILAQTAKNFCGQKYKNVKLETVFNATMGADHEFRQNLFNDLKLSDKESAHNSLYDVYMTISIYKYFQNHFAWKDNARNN